MQIFEYPYVIITILVFVFLIMGAMGIFFIKQSVKNANGAEVEKGFLSTSRLKKEYERLGKSFDKRCLVYVSVSLDTMSRLYSSWRAARTLNELQYVFLKKKNALISHPDTKSFILIVKGDDRQVIDVIQDVMSEINEIFIKNSAVNIVHVYFGYYTTTSNQVSFEVALNRAKKACTMAEDKNVSYIGWDSNNGKEFERKIKIENSIQNEIDNNSFFLAYQPILSAHNKEMVGAEVLSRLNSQEDGIVSPGKFLSAVKNVGLDERFDYYVFEKNCKWISNNKSRREKYVYTINFSRNTLSDEKFAEKIIEIVNKYGIKFSCIAVEVLEDKDLSADCVNNVVANIIALKEKGVLILLDDFGRGYTSLSDLDKLPVDIVKIDKAITQNAVTEKGFLILKNIIQTAKDLGYKTLCEGVETEEHETLVQNAGCDYLQGFYYYRPMNVAQLENLFEIGFKE